MMGSIEHQHQHQHIISACCYMLQVWATVHLFGSLGDSKAIELGDSNQLGDANKPDELIQLRAIAWRVTTLDLGGLAGGNVSVPPGQTLRAKGLIVYDDDGSLHEVSLRRFSLSLYFLQAFLG